MEWLSSSLTSASPVAGRQSTDSQTKPPISDQTLRSPHLDQGIRERLSSGQVQVGDLITPEETG